MHFIHPRENIFILALLFSAHVSAQESTAPLTKAREATVERAIDIANNIYADSQKNALTMVAMARNCVKFYPGLKEKIVAEIASERSGLDQQTRAAITALESSNDPYVKGQIDGAAIVTYDKDLMESACKAIAGVTP